MAGIGEVGISVPELYRDLAVGDKSALKIADGTKTTRKARRTPALSPRAAGADLPEFLQQSGLDAGDLTPQLANAFSSLLGEVIRLRTELAKARARATYLEKLAHEDALMPVANRRAFMRELSRLLTLAQRYSLRSSIIYIDLNGMKQINDTHGHNAGDAALQHVARILIDHVRLADVVARLGGDEFAVLLVKADQTAADQKAATLIAALEREPLQWNGELIHVNAAFGVYSFEGGETAAEALERADQAMYRSKQLRKAAAPA
jgi:diguanylate cyclase (GGDEF)-like protein